MHIIVVGAGVVGVTTAYELQSRGHQVTVLERHSAAGNETSRGNAAQRSYGVVYPWADPSMVLKAIPWLFKKDGPLKMSVPPSMETLRFMFATLRYAWSPGLFGLNKRAMIRLGIHSRERFLALKRRLICRSTAATRACFTSPAPRRPWKATAKPNGCSTNWASPPDCSLPNRFAKPSPAWSGMARSMAP